MGELKFSNQKLLKILGTHRKRWEKGWYFKIQKDEKID